MIEYISFGVGKEWIAKLWKSLKSRRAAMEREIEDISDILFCNPTELAQCYIEPDCQESNPADHHEEDFLVSREPILKKIDEFFRVKGLFDAGDNQLFILSDAGMGKTAFLAMLKLMNLLSFWPRENPCVLKKLGNDTLNEVSKIENKNITILLLDSLDEDPAAYGRSADRLQEILQNTRSFYRVIITCRTQFFPMGEQDPFKRPGRVMVKGFCCPVKYLSFFDDNKVKAYLAKRFPKKFGILTDTKKIEESQKVIAKMGSLRCRPMLLAYIDDLMASPLIDGDNSEYKVYDALVKSWLHRDASKKIEKPISVKDLLDACIILAAWMTTKRLRKIDETELNRLISIISKVKPVTEIDFKGRSLINRNSDGDYRFSHYTIQEFLVAKLLLEEPVWKPKDPIPITEFILKLITASKKVPNFIELLDFKESLNLTGYVFENQFGMKFAYIPPGKFMMGSPEDEAGRENDQALHEVTLTKGFFMQTTPVTQKQWQIIIGNNPSYFKGDDLPVENVSWNDVQKFIQKLNQLEKIRLYRLPTEAEWEYACRAGTQTRYYTGNTEADLDRAGWYDENSGEKTNPVGQKEANAFGLYDMHGNVWEWCRDWYGDYPAGSVTDPDGPSKGSRRVNRGGSWYSTAANCRSANRNRVVPDRRLNLLGFRLARSLP